METMEEEIAFDLFAVDLIAVVCTCHMIVNMFESYWKDGGLASQCGVSWCRMISI